MTSNELCELDAWIETNIFDGQKYGVKKRGLWYRPDAHGYTDRQSEAWRLSLEEAKKHEYKRGGYDEQVVIMPIDTPRYTTDPADAMEVLKKCSTLTPYAISNNITGFMVSDLDKKSRYGIGETLELAICLFAKKLFTK